MPAVDLAAIRADLATIDAGLPQDYTEGQLAAFNAAFDRILDAHVLALLARVEDLEARLDAANERTSAKCRELMAARRDVEQARAERDHWAGRFFESVPQRHVVGADVPVDDNPPPSTESAPVRPLETT